MVSLSMCGTHSQTEREMVSDLIFCECIIIAPSFQVLYQMYARQRQVQKQVLNFPLTSYIVDFIYYCKSIVHNYTVMFQYSLCQARCMRRYNRAVHVHVVDSVRTRVYTQHAFNFNEQLHIMKQSLCSCTYKHNSSN